VIGAPSRLRLMRKTAVLVRVRPTLLLSPDEKDGHGDASRFS
jgi:hypothetical protein